MGVTVTVERDRVRVGKRLSIALRLTVRVPDRAEPPTPSSPGSPLPPNLGPLPLHKASDYRGRVPGYWMRGAALFTTLGEREAFWLDFEAASPHAVKVGVGGVNAVTGEDWDERLKEPQDYVVCPPQQWLDGVRTRAGRVRQFVAMPSGGGYGVASQLTGPERPEALDIVVYGPKRGRAAGRWFGPDEGYGLESVGPPERVVAAGGEVAQRIYPDPYGVSTWERKKYAGLSIYIVGAEQYREWTGLEPPSPPPTAADYIAAGLPWYALNDETLGDVAPSERLARVRSVAEQDHAKGRAPDPSPAPVSPGRVILARDVKPIDERRRMMSKAQDDGTRVSREQKLRLLEDIEAINATLNESAAVETSAEDGEPLSPAAAGADEEATSGIESVPRGGTRKRRARTASPELRQERKRLIEAGASAVSKLQERGEAAPLTAEEERGLEAIVLLSGRPALLVQGGTYGTPPDTWSILNRPDVRPAIEKTIRSVGRIEVENHPGGLDWIGTGFLVAEDVVMTNRHVAVEFARSANGKAWEFLPRMKVRIDYVEELGAQNKAEFKITEVIGIHQDVDMALLRVSLRGSAGAKRPGPLPLAAKPSIKSGRQVYVVGYPASDSRRNDPVEMLRIFESIFDVKRLQPGKITGTVSSGTILNHDCSTLGGNSGSCVVDLETHQVVGLHFGGRYLVGNSAVILSKLRTDPLIKKAKLEFA